MDKRSESPAPPAGETAAQVLAEWDAEINKYGVWTSGHSIADRMARILRATAPPAGETARDESLLRTASRVAKEQQDEIKTLREGLAALVEEMTQALTLGALFNPEQFNTKDAILRWRDQLAARLREEGQ